MMNRNRKMLRRDFLFSLPGAASAAAAPRRPNFVFILADDLGWADLSCYGSPLNETPNLDRFAASGVRFTEAYAACPVCSPTRAAIMTGKYPARVGLTDYLPGLQPRDRKLLSVEDLDELPLEEVTLAEALRAAGYQTFTRGKWHLGQRSPAEHGFTSHKGPAYKPGRNSQNRDEEMTAESVDFLESAGKDPFFLYLCFTFPHTPVVTAEAYIEKYRAKVARMNLPAERLGKERQGVTRLYQDNPEYASMISTMDDNAGRVLDVINRRKELLENTVVVFTSDNGGLCTHQNPAGGPTSNRPLRSGKGWCYEGGIRVPLLVRAPGVTRAGAVCSAPVISTDHYPTMLELAGLPFRREQHMDGLSMAPLLRGKTSLPRQDLYWHYPHYHGSTWAPGAAVRSGDWKLIEFYDEESVELYNLREDPGERNNLAAKMPSQTRKLREQLRAWQKSVGAKMPQRNPAWRA